MSSIDYILLAMEPSSTLDLLERALRAAGVAPVVVKDPDGLERALREINPAVLVVSAQLGDQSGLELAKQTLDRFPTLPIIFYASRHDPDQVLQVMRAGLSDYLFPPLKINLIMQSIVDSQNRARKTGDWVRREVKRSTASLEARVSDMEALVNLSRSIAASLDLDSVLTSVVTAAVELTGAEEGHLLLLDEATQDLYMRASRNFDDQDAHTFRLPVNDSLAGQVIQTGKPISFCQDSPNKIKTSFLVYALVYVPLSFNGQVIGVLGVDNRSPKRSFTQHDELLMSVLADFATIAIQNARSYAASESERAKLQTILANIQDGVILMDQEKRVLMINPAARNAFDLGDSDVIGKRITEFIENTDFKVMINSALDLPLKNQEISLENGRVYNSQYTPIHTIGSVLTLEEITHLKMMDQLKSDFVHTISHDLRSPLTSIIGYIELLDRVGPLNQQQKEFVKHVQVSAHSITELINDLLDLGRIEAGFDAMKDEVAFGTILRYTLDNLQHQIEDKHQEIIFDIASDLPVMRGNPLRLRQVIDNLLVNAVKYTPENGRIKVSLRSESNQIIFEVADTGIGISPVDQPHIFEKFYRANNAPSSTPGTGLGLAIVKSIVENHSGRVWVESVLGRGTKFTVVLPSNLPTLE